MTASILPVTIYLIRDRSTTRMYLDGGEEGEWQEAIGFIFDH